MTGKHIKLHAEIVNGKCPTCDELTMLVGVTRDFYRCLSCGSDLHQHINGKISYLPALNPPEGTKPYVKEWVQMAKKSQFGVNLYHKQKPRKRPGRHKKNLNKHEKRQQKKRKKGT